MMKLRACLLLERLLHPLFRQIGHICSKEDLASKINPPRFLWVQEVGLAEKKVGLDELMLGDGPDPSQCVSCVVVGSKLKRLLQGFIALGIPAFPIVSSCQRRVAADIHWIERTCPAGAFNRRVKQSLLPTEAFLFKVEVGESVVCQSKIRFLFDCSFEKLTRFLVGVRVEQLHQSHAAKIEIVGGEILRPFPAWRS